MKHEIDLKKYNIYTDLAIDEINNNAKVTKYKKNNISVCDVYLEDNVIENKKKGNYVTIEFKDCTDKVNRKNITNILISELKKMYTKINVKKEDLCLVVGLGNIKSTPDSLGPKVIDDILVTNHLYKLNTLSNEYMRVCAFNTGVMGNTGIETSDLIKSCIDTIKPNFVIVIDSLASNSIERLNKTIQITDSGINPGSGVGNKRNEISFDTLGVPVIAVGVPTVVGLSTIVVDTINYMFKYYSYILDNKDNKSNKLMLSTPNYLKHKTNNYQVFGILDKLNDIEKKVLFDNVLQPIGYDLLVTDKEIDFTIDKLSNIISTSINKSLHHYSTNND